MSDRRRGRVLMWTADRKAVAMERICDRIASGEHLREIGADPWMPGRTTVKEWIRTEPACARQYSRALEERANMRSDRIDGYLRRLLAGEMTPEAARVAISAEQWLAGKEFPRRYGRYRVQETAHYERMSDAQLEAQIANLMNRLARAVPFGDPVRAGAHERVMG
jgi:hypothetical protein